MARDGVSQRDSGPAGDTGFILAVAAGLPVAEAARRAGISRRTASRRLADPAVKASIARARGAMLDSALGRLTAQSARAADRLGALMNASDEAVALRAARSILELTLKLRDALELVERIEALEAMTAGGKDGA